MTYTDLLRAFYAADYDRVERDDRLLDVFPVETREKGVELWERWDEHEVKIVRVRLPFEPAELKLFIIARGQLDSLLQHNKTAELGNFEEVAAGAAVLDCL